MLDQFLSQAVVAVLNRLLARESWARERLAPFAGRSARFEMTPFALSLAVGDGGNFAAAAGEPGVTVGLDPASAPALLLDPSAALRNVRLSGDAEFAQALSFVLQNLRPEPEEELARFIGDAAAVRIVGLLRAALAQAQAGGARLAETTADYFVTENPMLVGRPEADAFAREVNALRDAVARIEKRIERLEISARSDAADAQRP